MDPAIQAKIHGWLSGKFDQATKDEILKLKNENPAELADAFYKNLEFGTGGLRGLMGVGTNRMNKYTVGMATQGYANYLKKSFAGDPLRDRKSTRLNSSHSQISYAVFCLKKKNKCRDY